MKYFLSVSSVPDVGQGPEDSEINKIQTFPSGTPQGSQNLVSFGWRSWHHVQAHVFLECMRGKGQTSTRLGELGGAVGCEPVSQE